MSAKSLKYSDSNTMFKHHKSSDYLGLLRRFLQNVFGSRLLRFNRYRKLCVFELFKVNYVLFFDPNKIDFNFYANYIQFFLSTCVGENYNFFFYKLLDCTNEIL